MYPTKHFTKEEKDACLPIVDLMIDAANVARAQGVLALEEWIKTKDNKFLILLMMLVIDGTDPRLVQDIGSALLNADDHKGTEFLSRLLVAEGVLSVQAGENPRIMEAKLLAMLGESYLASATGYFGNEAPTFEQRMAALAAQTGLPGSEDFNAAFEAMANRDIQCVLRETDQHDLTLALKGCSGGAAGKFIQNLSKRLAQMILESMEYMGPVQTENILDAQKKIMDIVQKMKERQEIA
jgi:hypothetical protein